MPIPTSELASEYAPGSMMGQGGWRECWMVGFARRDLHHARWGMWHERAVTEYPEEGLQVGEVSSSLRVSVNGLRDGQEKKDFTFWYDLACM